jgi:hypothetical protein
MMESRRNVQGSGGAPCVPHGNIDHASVRDSESCVGDIGMSGLLCGFVHNQRSWRVYLRFIQDDACLVVWLVRLRRSHLLGNLVRCSALAGY